MNHNWLIGSAKWRWFVGIVSAMIMLGGVIWIVYSVRKNNQPLPQPSTTQLSAWLVEWQAKKGLEELVLLDEGMNNSERTEIQIFAAYYKEQEQLLITQGLQQVLTEVHKQRGALSDALITIVNDYKMSDGTSSAKDPEIIRRVLKEAGKRQAHLEEIVNLAALYNLGGIELDYERVPEELWQEYVSFIDDLQQLLAKDGRRLRVVLEPAAPIEKLILPPECDYVMMAYNLYGLHSGPGPKADKAFIAKLARRMQSLPKQGGRYVAFSAGGFDWSENGKVEALTHAAAMERLAIAKKQGVQESRDTASGAIWLKYHDDLNQEHTIWFADEVTLEGWMTAAIKSGGEIDGFALWRLGDNSVSSLNLWKKTIKK